MRTVRNRRLRGGEGGEGKEGEEDAHRNTMISGQLLTDTCPDAGQCLALGAHTETIMNYFDRFKTWDHVTHTIKRIGNESVNGIVLEIPFTKRNYTAYTVLKCSADAVADNLFYEYYVGNQFINKYVSKFPCFVSTYGYCQFKNDLAWKQMLSNAQHKVVPKELLKSISHVDINETDPKTIVNSCAVNRLGCVLIQHFEPFTTVGNIAGELIRSEDIYSIMYQVYYPLLALGNNYAHNDLHYNNVGLYKPYANNQYVLMRYHCVDPQSKQEYVVEFKSEYIAKIIDYGRNYFYVDGKNNSQQVLNNIYACAMRGKNLGYQIILQEASNYYSLKDHWFARILLDKINKYTKSPPYNYLVDTNTMLNQIRRYVTNNSNKYSGWTHMATMDVYNDGRDYTYMIHQDNELVKTAITNHSKQRQMDLGVKHKIGELLTLLVKYKYPKVSEVHGNLYQLYYSGGTRNQFMSFVDKLVPTIEHLYNQMITSKSRFNLIGYNNWDRLYRRIDHYLLPITLQYEYYGLQSNMTDNDIFNDIIKRKGGRRSRRKNNSSLRRSRRKQSKLKLK